MLNLSSSSPRQFVHDHFDGLKLGDLRLAKRTRRIVEAFAGSPGLSIPRLFKRWSQIKACYNLFHHPMATPDNLQAPHRLHVQEQICRPGHYLLLEDTSDISYSGREPIEELGPIGEGQGRLQGFLLHSVLAVHVPADKKLFDPDAPQPQRPPVELIGLADQQLRNRIPRPKTEKPHDSWASKKRQRESQVWEQATARLGSGEQDGSLDWVRVCDAGADIYENLYEYVRAQHGYVVRAAYNRSLLKEQGEHKRLFDLARTLAPRGHFTLGLRARPTQPARIAKLSVCWTAVTIKSPKAPGFSPGKRPSLECSVVRVFEQAAPSGKVPALEWILLTDRPVHGLEDAMEVALEYECRWIIEEFHKALKTGLGAEKLQLQTKDALFAAVSLMSVVALRLVDMRERTRVLACEPAEQSGLSTRELMVLAKAVGKRKLRTVKEVALAVGKLGGHIGRRSDGMPGMLTLWRGMMELNRLMRGVEIARQLGISVRSG